MRTRGVKLIDPVLETCQVEWLVLSAEECPDEISERRVVLTYFRVPHEPWGPGRAFVRPVEIRRSRYRVLFRQLSGVGD
jgi:hypothetical protein